MFRFWPYILLFFSGLTTLSYQVVWMREFRLVFGASTASTAAVSALFMAGLGFGSLILGPRADRHSRPLMLYGRLELAISILAGLSLLMIDLTRDIYLKSGGMEVLGLAGATTARLFLSALVIGIPAFLMGGTLPAAAKSVVSENDGARLGLGALYGINTLGALTGTLLTTFFIMEAFGARDTLTIAVILNFLTALVALKIGSKLSPQSLEIQKTALKEDYGDAAPAGDEVAYINEQRIILGLPSELALLSALVVGFAFFLMELVWYRMLGPVLGGSVYTFGLILATALGGIGLGGALHSVIFRNRRPNSWHLAATCLLEALLIMIPFAIGDWLPALAAQLRSLSAFGFGGLTASWAIITMLVVLPASIVSGVQFPLLISLLGRGTQNLGRQTGLVYAFNTTGSILGSLSGGFGLIPWLSAPGCWLMVGTLLTVLGLGIFGWTVKDTYCHKLTLRNNLPSPVSFILVLLLTCFCLRAEEPTAAWRHSPVGAGRVPISHSINDLRLWISNSRWATIWEADGVESSVGIEDSAGYSFLVNGKSDGSVIGDRGTQITIGLIGAALHPNPRKALVVGLGTGCTAGWLSVVPTIDQVDVVELEPAVIHMAKLSASANHNVVDKAEKGTGVRIIINDAREVLNTSKEKYDLIVSEPSNPYRAGIASLFTKEFYNEVAGRLAQGGFFLSWCQAYEINSESVFTILATLKTVFPYVECWTTQFPGDMMFLASMEPIHPKIPILTGKLSKFPFSDGFRIGWGTEGLKGFASHHLANNQFISHVAKSINPSNINTDDLTPVEYGYAHTVGQKTNFSVFDFYFAALNQGLSTPDWLPSSINFQDNIYNLTVSSMINDRLTLPPDLTTMMNEELRQRITAITAWNAKDFNTVINTWKKSKSELNRLEIMALADSLAQLGDETALSNVAKVEDWWPASSAIIRATLALKKDNLELAVNELEQAFELLQTSPWEIHQILDNGFRMALELSQKDRQFASRLLKVMKKPFALHIMEKNRKFALLDIGEIIDPQTAEGVLLQWFEPNPPWYESILRKRVSIYAATSNSLLKKATADYELYITTIDLSVNNLLLLGSKQ